MTLNLGVNDLKIIITKKYRIKHYLLTGLRAEIMAF